AVARDPLLAVGDERAALGVVEVEVDLAALEGRALPDRDQLQVLLAQPAGQVRQPIAALPGRVAVAEIGVALGHAEPPFCPVDVYGPRKARTTRRGTGRASGPRRAHAAGRGVSCARLRDRNPAAGEHPPAAGVDTERLGALARHLESL